MADRDTQPVTEGHSLLIPKIHAPNVGDLDTATTAHLAGVAERLAAARSVAPGSTGSWPTVLRRGKRCSTCICI